MPLLVGMISALLYTTALGSSSGKLPPTISQRKQSAPPGLMRPVIANDASGDPSAAPETGTGLHPLSTIQTTAQRRRSAPTELSGGATPGYIFAATKKVSPNNRARTPVECDDSGLPCASAHQEIDNQKAPHSASPEVEFYIPGPSDEDGDYLTPPRQSSVPREMFAVGSESSGEEEVNDNHAHVAEDEDYLTPFQVAEDEDYRTPFNAHVTKGDDYRTPFQPLDSSGNPVIFWPPSNSRNPGLLLMQELQDQRHQAALANAHRLSFSDTDHELGSEHGAYEAEVESGFPRASSHPEVDDQRNTQRIAHGANVAPVEEEQVDEQVENAGENVPLLGEGEKRRCSVCWCCHII